MGLPQLAEEPVARRAPTLGAVETGYVVARRRPLSELPIEKQEQVRKAYEDTFFCSEDGLELFGIYTDLGMAEAEKTRHPGGFVMSLPVNGSLPDALGRYGLQIHSEARERYEASSPTAVCEHAIDRGEIEKLNSGWKAHVKDLESQLQ